MYLSSFFKQEAVCLCDTLHFFVFFSISLIWRRLLNWAFETIQSRLRLIYFAPNIIAYVNWLLSVSVRRGLRGRVVKASRFETTRPSPLGFESTNSSPHLNDPLAVYDKTRSCKSIYVEHWHMCYLHFSCTLKDKRNE